MRTASDQLRRDRWSRWCWLWLPLLLVGCRALPWTDAATPTPTVPRPSEAELSWSEVEARLRPATVLVRFELPTGGPFLETGVAYAPGLVLTLAPPLDSGPPQRVQVVLPGSSDPVPADLRGISACDGIAVIAVDPATRLDLAPLGSVGAMQLGIDVLVYGHSTAATSGEPISAPAVVAGAVTDSRRGLEQVGVNIDLTGFTYGALLADRHGAVLGLYAPNGLFLSAEQARYAADRLAEGRGLLWLGVGLSPHRNPERFGTDKGLVVLESTPNGPAASAGLRPGMVLTHLTGTEIESFAQVCGIIREHRQGDELAVRFREISSGELVEAETRVRLGEPAPSTPTELRRAPLRSSSARPVRIAWTFERPDEVPDWPTGANQVGTGAIRDGGYTITLTTPNAFGVFPPTTVGPGTDQRITATVSLPEGAGAGLLVRSSQDPDGRRNFYLCVVVRADGQLLATCSVAIAGDPIVLVPVTPLADVDPTLDPLPLELEARDTRLTFRVADRTVADVENPLLGYGQVALWVESFQTVPVSVTFHDVEVEFVPR